MNKKIIKKVFGYILCVVGVLVILVTGTCAFIILSDGGGGSSDAVSIAFTVFLIGLGVFLLGRAMIKSANRIDS